MNLNISALTQVVAATNGSKRRKRGGGREKVGLEGRKVKGGIYWVGWEEGCRRGGCVEGDGKWLGTEGREVGLG